MRRGRNNLKKIIGIVPKSEKFDPEQTNYKDVYYLGNNYVKRIEEAGFLPVCIAPVDGWISEDALNLCDGFIAQGGQRMRPYHFQVIHHAVANRKRYLGICLGMQLIHRYFAMRKYVLDRNLSGDICENIIDILAKQGVVAGHLERVEGHRMDPAPRGMEDAAKHNVDIVPGTMLHRLMGKSTIRGASYHNWRVKDPIDELKVNAWASDGSGTIEGIEYADNILGVQFHPEVDDLLPELFQFLK